MVFVGLPRPKRHICLTSRAVATGPQRQPSLGTLAGLWAFGHLVPSDKPHQIPVVLPAVTDNRGNKSLIKKSGTTKLPLMLFNMQLLHLLRISCLRLSLGWKPRSENDVADQLTNEVFRSVNMDNRVQFCMSDLPLDLFNK